MCTLGTDLFGQKDVEGSGGEHTSLVCSNSSSEQFSYVVAMVDCVSHLVVEAFYGSGLVLMLYSLMVAHKAAFQTLSNVFLKSTKAW